MQHGCFLFVIYLYTNFVSTMHAPPWMYAGDDAEEEKEDIPHFSEDEEETMSQTGRPMTDEEMRAIGLTPPKDDLEDVEVDSTEEDDEEDEGMDGDGYFQKYGVMKPPPCPKPMPQQGGKMRPPEPPGPPPGRAKAEPVPAAAKGPCTVPPPPPPPQVTTVEWTKTQKVCQTTVLPPPPPPKVEAAASSSSSKPCEAVVPYEEEYDEYELEEDPDPKSTTSTEMVKWKQQLGYIYMHSTDVKHDIHIHCMTKHVMDTCQRSDNDESVQYLFIVMNSCCHYTACWHGMSSCHVTSCHTMSHHVM